MAHNALHLIQAILVERSGGGEEAGHGDFSRSVLATVRNLERLEARYRSRRSVRGNANSNVGILTLQEPPAR